MSISNVFIVAAQLYKQSQDKVLVDKQTNKADITNISKRSKPLFWTSLIHLPYSPFHQDEFASILAALT